MSDYRQAIDLLAFIQRHPGHGDQKVHGRRGGGSASIEDEGPLGGSFPKAAKQGWEQTLTESEVAAANDYTLGGYKTLNSSLRDGRPLSAKDEALARNLDSLIDKAGAFDEPVTVYRGVYMGTRAIGTRGVELAGTFGKEREDKIIAMTQDFAKNEFKPGSIIKVEGFQSTSFYVEPALDASLGREAPGIIFKIQAKRGAHLNPETGLSVRDDEAELLLSRNTSYTVKRVLPSAVFEMLDGDMRTETVIEVEQND